MELMKVNDLEDKIMKVWSTSDDIDLLLDWISDHVLIYDTDTSAGEDELMNLLIGIKSLHHQRCHVLFRDFEKVLANSKKDEVSRHERTPGQVDQLVAELAAEDTAAASLAKAGDAEDFTTYAPSGAPIRTAEGLLA